jgi:hypothetical protein
MKWLTIAVTLAALAVPPAEAAAASTIRGSATTLARVGVPATSATAGSRHLARNQFRPKQVGTSYFRTEAAILAALLGGILVLGLWGDVAIGAVVSGIWALTAGAGAAARKAYTHARRALGGDTAPAPSAPEAHTAPEALGRR